MAGETKVSERDLLQKHSLQLSFNLPNFKITELVVSGLDLLNIT